MRIRNFGKTKSPLDLIGRAFSFENYLFFQQSTALHRSVFDLCHHHALFEN